MITCCAGDIPPRGACWRFLGALFGPLVGLPPQIFFGGS
nr:MAG TPA: hypothetical protein [Caudoviricetes sp.]